jgi:hypothetical protein
MGFRVDAVTAERAAEVQEQTEQKQTNTMLPSPATNGNARVAELKYTGATVRRNLEEKLAQQTSPSKALEEINTLPKPDPSDAEAVRAYKQKRAEIADNAIQNAQPPEREDFKGLSPRVADMEYRDALAEYNRQIDELKKISAEARAYPDRILTPSEALNEINSLPRPDRNNPDAIRAYNRRRAEIANAALMYAEPPKREDFNGLPPSLAAHEYREAKAAYDSQISQLRDAASADNTTTPPPITDAEANQAADGIINRHGGRDNLDAEAAGRELAEIARRNPNDAAIIGQKIFKKIEGTSKQDNVSQSFVNSLSDEELRRVAQDPDGRLFLEKAKNHMLSGNVHSDEVKAAGRIDKAITGFDPQSLNGDPEHDARVIDQQLKALPPEMRQSFVKAVLNHPAGPEALRYAATMSPESQKALGQTLGQLYQRNPSETMELLRRVTDAPGGIPYYYQSGMAKVIAQSGNDDLIRAYAQHELDKAKRDPEQVRGYLHAVTAWSGLSPEALQQVMKNNPDFYKAVEEAGRLTKGPGNVSGFPNYNILEPGLGNLLKKASQIKGANGQATPEALKLFATAVKYAGDNFFTQEGAGAFFIEHARQIIDTYADPRSQDFNPEVLQTFFANVIYAPGSKALRYNGRPLVDVIMGDGQGRGGVLGEVMEAYLKEAKRPNDTEEGRENDQYIGQKIGFLWGAVSGGLLDAVKVYKDRFNEDKELRDFAFGLLKKGLGQIADKLDPSGAANEVVDKAVDFGQKIYEAGKEKEKQEQLDKFKQAFSEMNRGLLRYITDFEVNTSNVEGLQDGFLTAETAYLTNYLVNDWIGQ